MDNATFETIERKYAAYASWAVWNPADLLDSSVIRENLGDLKTSVVMVALNISRALPADWRNFHSRDHARKLMLAFNASPYRGAYMTDLIKNESDPDSGRLSQRIQDGAIDVQHHLATFREEMRDIGATDRTLFVLFGQPVTRLFRKHLALIYPNNVSCVHYSMYGTGFSDAEWVAKTWRTLEEHSHATADRFDTLPFFVDASMSANLAARQRH
jgi:hypothetical protein